MFEARSILCSAEPEVEQVMQCLLGIRDLEIKAFFALLKKPDTPQQLSKKLGKSRSLVQRSLQNLVGYGLAYRKSVRRQRGRAYKYVAVPKKEAKKIMLEAFEKWSRAVKESIKEW